MLHLNKLGKRIKQARKEKHMTAETFAEKVGISISFLREIERGNKKTEYLQLRRNSKCSRGFCGRIAER